jgi:hypothetical protein
MENYIGCKIIKAELSNFAEYKKKKYGELAVIDEGDHEVECYIVIYPPIGNEENPYISMSPKDVFEKCYRLIENAEISLINGFFD